MKNRPLSSESGPVFHCTTKSHGWFLKYDTVEIGRVFQLSYANIPKTMPAAPFFRFPIRFFLG